MRICTGPTGKEFGIVGGMNPDGPNDPRVQAVAAVVNFVPADSPLAKGFLERVAKASAKGEKVVLKEVSELSEEAAKEIVAAGDAEAIVQALAKEGVVGPYKIMKIFTEKMEGRWQAHHILEKQMFERFKLKFPDLSPSVILSEAEHKKITATLRAATEEREDTGGAVGGVRQGLREKSSRMVARHQILFPWDQMTCRFARRHQPRAET